MLVNIVGVYLNLKNHSLVHFSCSRVSDIVTQIYHVNCGLGNFNMGQDGWFLAGIAPSGHQEIIQNQGLKHNYGDFK